MSLKIIVLQYLAVVVTSSIATPENLHVVITNAKLPSGVGLPSIGYDGADSIYLWGGRNSLGFVWTVLKYSITEETVESIGKTGRDGVESWTWVGNDTMFYIGGYSGSGQKSYIWKSKTSSPNSWMEMKYISKDCTGIPSIWDEGENVYVIGGLVRDQYKRKISKYSLITQKTVDVSEMPYAPSHYSAMWDITTRSAYIFGGGESGFYSLNQILKFDSVNGKSNVTKLNVTLPSPILESCVIWTGKEAYVIGGRTESQEEWIPLIRFNPSSNEVTIVPVNNFPEQLVLCGCIYVKKLNRIYLFGGFGTDGFKKEIMYINLGGPSKASVNNKDNVPLVVSTSESFRTIVTAAGTAASGSDGSRIITFVVQIIICTSLLMHLI